MSERLDCAIPDAESRATRPYPAHSFGPEFGLREAVHGACRRCLCGALVSNHSAWNPTLVRQFIDAPLSVLARPRCAAKLALLQEMKDRYDEYRRERSREQENQDRRQREEDEQD